MAGSSAVCYPWEGAVKRQFPVPCWECSGTYLSQDTKMGAPWARSVAWSEQRRRCASQSRSEPVRTCMSEASLNRLGMALAAACGEYEVSCDPYRTLSGYTNLRALALR